MTFRRRSATLRSRLSYPGAEATRLPSLDRYAAFLFGRDLSHTRCHSAPERRSQRRCVMRFNSILSSPVNMKLLCIPALLCLVTLNLVLADGPADNLPDKVRRVPPPGIQIAEAER